MVLISEEVDREEKLIAYIGAEKETYDPHFVITI